MAFKTIRVGNDIRFTKDELDFCCQVNIDKDGMFTTYLPEDIVDVFEKAGISLEQNPAQKSHTGFFSDATLYGLGKQIAEIIEEYFSRVKIER